jgi:hypothetical protein
MLLLQFFKKKTVAYLNKKYSGCSKICTNYQVCREETSSSRHLIVIMQHVYQCKAIFFTKSQRYR